MLLNAPLKVGGTFILPDDIRKRDIDGTFVERSGVQFKGFNTFGKVLNMAKLMTRAKSLFSTLNTCWQHFVLSAAKRSYETQTTARAVVLQKCHVFWRLGHT